MRQLTSTHKGLMVIVLTAIGLILCGTPEGVRGQEAVPTIEELTEGKVKVGDLVTKENVELVKKYLPAHIYELVKQGMVLEMGENVPPWAIVPKWFREVTKQNHEQYGTPVMNENAVIYTKDGNPWPGGTPFLEPATALEVGANVKYECAIDGFYIPQVEQLFVNRKGRAYKTVHMDVTHTSCNSRLTLPPIGAAPGLEEEHTRNLIIITHPFELKGLGQLQIKHWDDAENADKGFAYIPSFKRIIRISATTYQDNLAGSDYTWGDPNGGYLEPFSHWTFKLVGKRNVLVMQPFGDKPIVNSDGSVDIGLQWDEGKRFIRDKWVVMPVYVVEHTPKIKHIYGKRVWYIACPPYSNCFIPIMATDYYDRQMQLWKGWNFSKYAASVRGEPISLDKCQSMYDLQTGHQSLMPNLLLPNQGTDPTSLTLKLLIAKGR